MKLNENNSIETAKNIWKTRMLAKDNQNISTTSKPSDEFAEAKAKTLLPSREVCPICKGEVPLDNDNFAECNKKHEWKRCHITLKLLSSSQYRTCKCCYRHAQNKIFENSSELEWMKNIVNIDNCLLCNGKLVVTL